MSNGLTRKGEVNRTVQIVFKDGRAIPADAPTNISTLKNTVSNDTITKSTLDGFQRLSDAADVMTGIVGKFNKTIENASRHFAVFADNAKPAFDTLSSINATGLKNISAMTDAFAGFAELDFRSISGKLTSATKAVSSIADAVAPLSNADVITGAATVNKTLGGLFKFFSDNSNNLSGENLEGAMRTLATIKNNAIAIADSSADNTIRAIKNTVSDNTITKSTLDGFQRLSDAADVMTGIVGKFNKTIENASRHFAVFADNAKPAFDTLSSINATGLKNISAMTDAFAGFAELDFRSISGKLTSATKAISSIADAVAPLSNADVITGAATINKTLGGLFKFFSDNSNNLSGENLEGAMRTLATIKNNAIAIADSSADNTIRANISKENLIKAATAAKVRETAEHAKRNADILETYRKKEEIKINAALTKLKNAQQFKDENRIHNIHKAIEANELQKKLNLQAQAKEFDFFTGWFRDRLKGTRPYRAEVDENGNKVSWGPFTENGKNSIKTGLMTGIKGVLIGGAIGLVIGLVKKAVQAIATAVKTIMLAPFKMMFTLGKKILGFFKNILASNEQFKQLMNMIVTPFMLLFSLLFAPVLVAMAPVLKDFVGVIVDKKDQLKELGERVGDFLVWLVSDQGLNLIGEGIDMVTGFVEGALDILHSISYDDDMKTLTDKIAGFMSGVATNLIDWLYSEEGTKIRRMFAEVFADFVLTIGQVIVATIPLAIDNLITFCGHAWDRFFESIANMVQFGLEWIYNTVVTPILETFGVNKDVIDAGRASLAPTAKFTTGITSEFARLALSPSTYFAGKFADFGNTMVDWGSNLFSSQPLQTSTSSTTNSITYNNNFNSNYSGGNTMTFKMTPLGVR